VNKALLLKTTLAVAMATPLLASAESQLITAPTGSAVARLDFRVIVPRVLFLGVGTGAGGIVNNTTVDTVTFDYTTNAAAVGTGAAAAVISGAVVPVRVIGNNGQITLTATTTGALTNATSDTIQWSEISAVSSLPLTLPSPIIPNSGVGTSSNVTLSSGTKITDRSANWTFSYANTAVVAPGTYGTTNGRVTYTAAMP
jgi:hypothetical protein